MATALVVFATALAVAAQDEVETRDRGQIRFARGKSETIVRGRIARGLRDQYLVRARAGQVMTLVFESVDASAGFDVFVTRGLEALPVTTPDEWQRRWSGRLPAGDEYYVNVGTRGEGGEYQFQIKIENARAGAASSSAASSSSASPVASAAGGSVARELRSAFARVKRETGVPVLLPDELPAALDHPLYVFGGGTPEGYDISLALTPRCGGANACTVGFFGAERGGTATEELEAVALGGGLTGRYKPLTCGASCSAPSIEWVSGGVLYTIQLKLNHGDNEKDRADLVALANSAIKAGPR
jgi:hypothetical protein